MCLLSLRDHCFSLLPTSTLHYYFRFSEIPDSTCLRGGCGRKCSQPRFRFRSTPSHLHLVRFSSILVLFSEPLLHLPRLPLPSCRLIHHDELPRCSRFVLQVGPSRARKALIHIYSSPHVGRYRSTLCACVALRCVALPLVTQGHHHHCSSPNHSSRLNRPTRTALLVYRHMYVVFVFFHRRVSEMTMWATRFLGRALSGSFNW